MSDTEFTYDRWGNARFMDGDGDSISIESDNVGGGMDLVIETSSAGARVNARELIAAVRKVADLDPAPRGEAVTVQVFEPTGNEECYFGPAAKGESAIALLVELYAEKLKSGASDEQLAATMARIHREIEVTR